MARAVVNHSKMSLKMVLIFLSIFFMITPTEGFVRLLCFNPLGFARVDPIVSPGRPSAHLHHLHGPGNLNIDTVNADDLLTSNCTSCSITVDKSAYWAPAMYFLHANGTYELMSTSGSITIYYKTEKRVNFEDQNYTAFPQGFRMVAGDTTKRNWVGPWPIPEQSWWGPNDTSQDALASKALGFNCLNYVRGWDEATFAYQYLRNKEHIDANCLQGVRAEILFPSCWDGINLDSPDHKSHVVYPTLLQDGACPDSHPVFLPVLFYETIWNTQDFIGLPGNFTFSNGDPTGYGYHADFLAAWEDGVFEQVMADPKCTDHDLRHRKSGGIQEECPVLAGSIQDQADAALCKLQVPEKLFQEKMVNVGSIQTILPGNVKMTGVRHDPGTNPEDFNLVAAPVASNAAPEPVASPSSSVVAVSASSTPVANTEPPAPTAGPPATSGPSAITTVTSSFISGGVLYEVEEVHVIVTVTNSVVPTITATTTATVNRKRHVHGALHHE